MWYLLNSISIRVRLKHYFIGFIFGSYIDVIQIPALPRPYGSLWSIHLVRLHVYLSCNELLFFEPIHAQFHWPRYNIWPTRALWMQNSLPFVMIRVGLTVINPGIIDCWRVGDMKKWMNNIDQGFELFLLVLGQDTSVTHKGFWCWMELESSFDHFTLKPSSSFQKLVICDS